MPSLYHDTHKRNVDRVLATMTAPTQGVYSDRGRHGYVPSYVRRAQARIMAETGDRRWQIRPCGFGDGAYCLGTGYSGIKFSPFYCGRGGVFDFYVSHVIYKAKWGSVEHHDEIIAEMDMEQALREEIKMTKEAAKDFFEDSRLGDERKHFVQAGLRAPVGLAA